MSAQRPNRATEAFFGRRRGKALRPQQLAVLETVLPSYRIEPKDAAPSRLETLFQVQVKAVRLEIGFGGGEHLLHEASRFPDTGFIGVEPFVNGMSKLLRRLQQAPLANIRLYDDDATRLLDWLPASSLSEIDLLYPDPWPKVRHWKRRFVSRVNLDRFARALAPGGTFRFASDIATYVNWTLLHCRAHPHFEWRAGDAGGWHKPYEGWPGTRYEAKALREGRRPAYLTFDRV